MIKVQIMYKSFFGLSELPFSISPNPKYFYLSSHHKEALSMLRHGIMDSGGFVLFTGEVGTGKTVILRTLLNSMPEDIATAVIYDPALPLLEMLEKICEEFGIQIPDNAGKRTLTDLISDFLKGLHAQGKRAVLLIDEAQLIPDEVVEQVRLLTNIETDNKKILQVILVGQPELQEKFRQSHMRQVAQRITARFHLLPLSLEEVDAYLRYRMQAAGCVQIIFSNPAVSELYRYSHGIPRIINVVADRALLAAYVDRSPKVERRHMQRAAREVLGTKTLPEKIKERLQVLQFSGKMMPLAVTAVILTGIGYFLGTCTGKSLNDFSEREVIQELKADPDVMALAEEVQDLRTRQKNFETVKREQTRFAADILNNSFEESSWKNLVQLWGVTSIPDDAREAWKYLGALGYRCLRGKSSLGDLERYNVPAVVQLMDKKLTPFYAVLLKMNEQYAVILMNGREWIMPREWLEDSFEGDFTLIWPLPDGFSEVDENSSRKAQEQVFNMLRRYDSGDETEFRTWDSDVQNMVSAFQRDSGLPETGVASIETLWALLPYADTDNPLYNQYILPEDLERARRGETASAGEVPDGNSSGEIPGGDETGSDDHGPSPADLALSEILDGTDSGSPEAPGAGADTEAVISRNDGPESRSNPAGRKNDESGAGLSEQEREVLRGDSGPDSSVRKGNASENGTGADLTPASSGEAKPDNAGEKIDREASEPASGTIMAVSPAEVRDRTLNGVNLRTAALNAGPESDSGKKSGKDAAGKTTDRAAGKPAEKTAEKPAGKKNDNAVKSPAGKSAEKPSEKTESKNPEKTSDKKVAKPASSDNMTGAAPAMNASAKDSKPSGNSGNIQKKTLSGQGVLKVNSVFPARSEKSDMGLDMLNILESEASRTGVPLKQERETVHAENAANAANTETGGE